MFLVKLKIQDSHQCTDESLSGASLVCLRVTRIGNGSRRPTTVALRQFRNVVIFQCLALCLMLLLLFQLALLLANVKLIKAFTYLLAESPQFIFLLESAASFGPTCK